MRRGTAPNELSRRQARAFALGAASGTRFAFPRDVGGSGAEEGILTRCPRSRRVRSGYASAWPSDLLRVLDLPGAATGAYRPLT